MAHANNRLRVRDWLLHGNAHEVGVCQNDLATACNYLYRAQQRLIYAREAGDHGWLGAWAEILFPVSSTDPYITLPRGVTRIQWAVGCDRPIPQQNQFYEYMTFGVGRTPEPGETNGGACCGTHTGTFCDGPRIQDKGWVATQAPVAAGSTLRFYITSPDDAGLRALVSGLDTNNLVVSGTDSGVLVQGEYVTFASPLATTLTGWNSVSGLQKDVTTGFVAVYAVDPATGDETLVAMLEPGEEVASYRRYFLPNLPATCCAGVDPVPVRALCKLDLLPLRSDSDYLVIQNLEALNAEVASVRLGGADGMANKAEARERHQAAVSLLNGELVHALGTQQPAIDFAPFGHARLRRHRVAMQ